MSIYINFVQNWITLDKRIEWNGVKFWTRSKMLKSNLIFIFVRYSISTIHCSWESWVENVTDVCPTMCRKLLKVRKAMQIANYVNKKKYPKDYEMNYRKKKEPARERKKCSAENLFTTRCCDTTWTHVLSVDQVTKNTKISLQRPSSNCLQNIFYSAYWDSRIEKSYCFKSSPKTILFFVASEVYYNTRHIEKTVPNNIFWTIIFQKIVFSYESALFHQRGVPTFYVRQVFWGP